MIRILVSRSNTGYYLILKTKLNKKVMDIFTKFSGFTKFKERDFWVRITPQNIEYLLDNFGEYELIFDEESRQIYDDHILAIEGKRELMKKKEITYVEADGYQFKREPMQHQLNGFMISKDMAEFALLYEQGLGKTKVIIDNAAYLYEKGEIDMLVVIAWPNGLHINWTDYEIPEDMPDRIPHDMFYWKSNLTKKKINRMNEVILNKKVLSIASFNVEAFSSGKAREWLTKCLLKNRCMLVIDQSASIKNPVAKRTKWLIKQASGLSKYRRILDGAPVAENAGELYSQFYFLNWEIIGCDTYTAFKNEFCITGRFNQVEGYTNIDRLMKRIEPFYSRVLEEDCLDLPKRIYKRFYFELTADEKRLYLDISKRALTEFKGELLETPLAITKSVRLQQISSGWFPSIEGNKAINNIPSRLTALKSLLSTFPKGDKVLIYARFIPDMRLIGETLENCVTYFGETPTDERELNKKAFQFGDAQYMVGNSSTMGIGHTLTAASHIVFYSNQYSLRLRLESEKRAHRKGQEKSLQIWDLVGNKTKDSKIIEALKGKKDVSDMILNDPENFFLEEIND